MHKLGKDLKVCLIQWPMSPHLQTRKLSNQQQNRLTKYLRFSQQYHLQSGSNCHNRICILGLGQHCIYDTLLQWPMYSHLPTMTPNDQFDLEQLPRQYWLQSVPNSHFQICILGHDQNKCYSQHYLKALQWPLSLHLQTKKRANQTYHYQLSHQYHLQSASNPGWHHQPCTLGHDHSHY